jgi:transcriptional regulator with XRE-family HTH domain
METLGIDFTFPLWQPYGMDHPIKQFRTREGLSQAQMAQRLGVTKGTVCRWERGQREPRAPQREMVAAQLGISVGELLEGN